MASVSIPTFSMLISSGQKYILGALPENYRLYEHVKVTNHEVTGICCPTNFEEASGE